MLNLADPRYFLPLPQLMGSIRGSASKRNEPYQQALERYLRTQSFHSPWQAGCLKHACDFQHRSDLHLVSYLSPRASVRASRAVGSERELMEAVTEQLNAGDLEVSLLRVVAMSSVQRLMDMSKRAGPTASHDLLQAIERRSKALARTRTPHDNLLASIGLAHAELVLRPSGAGLVARIELAGINELLQRITSSIERSFADTRHGLPLDGDGGLRCKFVTTEAMASNPDPLGTTVAIVRSIHGILSYFLSDDLFVEDEYSSAAISKNLDEAARLQWICWKTARHLRRRFAGQDDDFDEDCRFKWLEAAALAQLAQFDRMRRRHPTALRYAVASMNRARECGGTWSDLAAFNSLGTYLDGQGVTYPRLATHCTIRPEWQTDRPCLALRAAQEDPTLRKAMQTFAQNAVNVSGWGVSSCIWVRDTIADDKVREAAFWLLVRMGAVAEVRCFFHVPRHEEPTREGIFRKAHRRNTALRVGLEGAIGWANAIAAVAQSAAPWLDSGRQQSVKAGMRKLLRELPGSERGETTGDLLFLNHVQVGLSYHGKAVHQNGYGSPRVTDWVDGLLDAGEHGRLPRVAAQDFREGKFAVHPDDVFVSLVNDDGASLKMLLVGPEGSRKICRPTCCQIARDWDVVLKEFAKSAAAYQETVHGVFGRAMADRPGQPLELLEIPEELSALCEALIDEAVALNPNARRIMLHADPMWNVVPWQYVHLCGSETHGARLEVLHRSGVRRGSRGFGKIAFWRVPGVQLARYEPKGLAPSDVRVDVSESRFYEIGERIKAERANASPKGRSRGQLSILAHGSVADQHVRFKINGEFISASELAKLGEFNTIFLHVCHGAAMNPERLYRADDILGAPGQIIQGGARVVVAAGLPVVEECFLKLEQYYFDFDPNKEDLLSFEHRYLQACLETRAVSLYTLFSGAIAPRLDSIND